MIADYLVMGNMIAARLTETVAELRSVKTAADIAGIEEKSIQTPCCFVLYQGDNPQDGQRDFDARMVTQRWLVILAVRNKRDQAGGAGVQEIAGPLLSQIIDSIGTWQPGTNFRRPQRTAGPSPGWSPGGSGYYPLAYRCDIINSTD